MKHETKDKNYDFVVVGNDSDSTEENYHSVKDNDLGFEVISEAPDREDFGFESFESNINDKKAEYKNEEIETNKIKKDSINTSELDRLKNYLNEKDNEEKTNGFVDSKVNDKHLKKEMKKAKKKEMKKKEKEIRKKNKNSSNSLNIYKALTEKITGMGYSYNMLSLFKTLFLYSFMVIVFGYFHHLKIYYSFMLIILFMILLPFSIYYQFKYFYEQKRFNQLKTYLKFMRLNFKQYHKIITALTETKENFDKSDDMYSLIELAVNNIKKGNSYRESLDIIEKPFKNSYITKLHAYMILSENEGGQSAYNALDTIGFESWETDTYIFQTEKYKYQKQNGGYTLFGLCISLAVIFLFNYIQGAGTGMFDGVFDSIGFQLATFIYMLVDVISLVVIKTMITGKWIKEDE